MDSPPLSGAVIDMGIPQSEHRMDEKPRHRDGNDGNVSLEMNVDSVLARAPNKSAPTR